MPELRQSLRTLFLDLVETARLLDRSRLEAIDLYHTQFVVAEFPSMSALQPLREFLLLRSNSHYEQDDAQMKIHSRLKSRLIPVVTFW
jgi:hypothetical protein